MPSQSNNGRKLHEKAFNIRLSKSCHRDLKLLSIELNLSLAEICRKAIGEYIEKNKRLLKVKNAKNI